MNFKRTNLIYGGMNTGKSSLMLREIMENLNNNLFVFDSKGEYYPNLKDFLESRHYQIKVINLEKPCYSNGFNIFSYPYYLYQNNEVDEAIKLIKNIALSFCMSPNQKNYDDFWTNSAMDLLSSLILIMFKEGSSKEINYKSLMVLLQMVDNDILSLQNYVMSLDVTDPIYLSASTFLYAPKETRGGITATLKTVMNAYLMEADLMKMLSTNDLEIKDIKEPIAIFLIAKDYKTSLMNIILEQLLKTKLPFTYVFDNFNVITKILNINEYILYAKTNNLTSYFITNNLDAMNALYDKSTFLPIEVKEESNENESNLEIKEVEYPRLKETDFKLIAKLPKL